jgi:hypothetical protein
MSSPSRALSVTIGHPVHYVSHGSPVRADGTQRFTSVCRAAIVTAIPQDSEDDLSLCVLNPEGMHFQQNVPYSSTAEAGTWHWAGVGEGHQTWRKVPDKG